jgi:ubiquinone/menaquinone biosynthesis C-methylase UbiE
MSSERTKQFWSSGFGAQLYRAFSGGFFLKIHRIVAEEIIKRNSQDVLDVACGGGDFLSYLSAQAPQIHLKGTDLAPGMVTHARQKLGSKAEILEAQGEAQPFPPNSFDAVTIMMAFHHFPDKLGALRHLHTLLRPGGVLIITDVIARSNFEKKLWNVLERMIAVRGFMDHYTEAELQRHTEAAGFFFSIQYVPKMAKRYRICILIKEKSQA